MALTWNSARSVDLKILVPGIIASPLRLLNLSLVAGLMFEPLMVHSAFAGPLAEDTITWTGTHGDPEEPQQPTCTVTLERNGKLGFNADTKDITSDSEFGGESALLKVVANSYGQSDANLAIVATTPVMTRNGNLIAKEKFEYGLVYLAFGPTVADGLKNAVVSTSSKPMVPLLGDGGEKDVHISVKGTLRLNADQPIPDGLYKASSTVTCEAGVLQSVLD